MTTPIEPRKQARILLLAGIAAITLVLVLSMKFFLSDEPAAAPGGAADRVPLFSEPAAGKSPPGLNPVSRSETGSGGGLDMFSKTNAGYYGEEESTAPAAAQQPAAQAVGKSTAPAAARTAAVKRKAGTVIPRMQSSSFGTISPSNVAAHDAGQSMPDISNLLNQAQQQAGKK